MIGMKKSKSLRITSDHSGSLWINITLMIHESLIFKVKKETIFDVYKSINVLIHLQNMNKEL